MTTSATATFELSIDSLLRRSFQIAGLIEASQSPRSDDLSMARDFLGMELDALQADGVVLRTVIRTTLPLIASTSSYTLDNDTIDVALDPGNMAGMIVPASDGETPVRAIARAEYQQIVTKDTEALPTLVYIEKQATTTLHFWPVPPDSTLTFSYSKIRLPRDSTTGSNTPDLARRWAKAICYQMAWQIAMAKSVPLSRVQALQGLADSFMTRARLGDTEKGAIQLYAERYYG